MYKERKDRVEQILKMKILVCFPNQSPSAGRPIDLVYTRAVLEKKKKKPL